MFFFHFFIFLCFFFIFFFFIFLCFLCVFFVLVQMDGDVEVDIDPTDAENDAIAVENGSLAGSMGSMSGLQSPFNSNWSSSQPRSRDPSFEAEVRQIR